MLKGAPYVLYMNSYLHYCKKIMVDIGGFGIKSELIVYYLDRRFTTTNNLDELQKGFPYCKLKHVDRNYIEIISKHTINQSNMFYNLLGLGLIVPIDDFVNIVEGG